MTLIVYSLNTKLQCQIQSLFLGYVYLVKQFKIPMLKILIIITVILAYSMVDIIFASEENTTSSDNIVIKKKYINFQDIVRLNHEYLAVAERCPLRMSGGVKGSAQDVPYRVAIRRTFNRGWTWYAVCGGTIVTDRHVITAAGCFEKPRLISTRVIAGADRSDISLPTKEAARTEFLKEIQAIETWRQISGCFKHPRYDKKKFVHDIAVLQVFTPIQFSEHIKPILMLTPHMDLPDNTLCLVSGFGLLDKSKKTQFLRMVCVPKISLERCVAYFGALRERTQVCSGIDGRQNCQGDPGGPMVCKGVLTGVVSYGGRKCDKKPGVYTRLSGYTGDRNIYFRESSSERIQCDAFVIVIALAFMYIYYTANSREI